MIIFYVFFTKIILQNFLIAILNSTFKLMEERGEFSYQCNQYQFIERYNIAMLDEWGYAELVFLPPPMNVLTVFLLPCVMKKTLMKRGSEIFSKLIFWLENTIYILVTLIYELLYVPFIYIKVLFNIIRLASFLNMLFLLFLWTLFGLFFLLSALCKDMFYFIKILCDYKIEDD